MDAKNTSKMITCAFLLVFTLSLISSVIVDADYATVYSGEQVEVRIEVDNNEDFDIDDVSLALNLADIPFTTVGSSEKDFDDLDEGDDDTVTFTLRASTSIIPGDYDIPYTLKYDSAENSSQSFTKTGNFGIRVSSRTDLDFIVETDDAPIIGTSGQITLEIVNRGLGEIKSVSVEIVPQGFDVTSGKKIFVGSIDGEDSDTATFDVLYRGKNPNFAVNIDYKDFDNQDQAETINLQITTYTKEEAISRGIIERQSYTLYIVAVVLILLFIIWRIGRRRKKKLRER
jgi:hypothetical protein